MKPVKVAEKPARRRKAATEPDTPGAALSGGTAANTGGGAEASPPVAVLEPAPPGSETLPAANADGVTPLEVMLQVMRKKWRLGDHEGAASLARAAASYVHVKAGIGREGVPEIRGMSDAELELIVRGGEGEPEPSRD